jgi:hypothetical protein
MSWYLSVASFRIRKEPANSRQVETETIWSRIRTCVGQLRVGSGLGRGGFGFIPHLNPIDKVVTLVVFGLFLILSLWVIHRVFFASTTLFLCCM